MRLTTISLLCCIFLNAPCQKNDFEKFKQDSVFLPTQLSYKKLIKLHLDSAIILVDFYFFKEKLHTELKGCKKQIRQRKRIKANPITANQLAGYQKAYKVVDSLYKQLQQANANKDTIDIFYVGTVQNFCAFGDNFPYLIENGKCLVADTKFKIQAFIIRQIGWQKTSKSHSAGSRLYFIPGHEKHFWWKWDWST